MSSDAWENSSISRGFDSAPQCDVEKVRLLACRQGLWCDASCSMLNILTLLQHCSVT